MLSGVVMDGEYSDRWLGFVNAGAAYGYIALLASSVPTLVLGWPVSLFAHRHHLLKQNIVLLGAMLLGSLYLGATGSVIFKSFNLQALLLFIAAGGIGGLINGAIFFKMIKPNTSLNTDATR